MPKSDARIKKLETNRRTGRDRWQVRWWGSDGHQARRTLYSYGEARDLLHRVEQSKRTGTYIAPSQGRRRLGAYFVDFMAQNALEESTKALYETEWRVHVAPALGDVALAAIGRARVKQFVADLRTAGVGARTVQVCHGLLRRVLAEAVRDGLIAANPAAGVTAPASERRSMQPLGAAEVTTLADEVEPRDRALILTLAYTGIRIGEAAALRVRHVDLMRGRLHVAGSAGEVGGQRIEGSTKSDRERSVMLPAFLRDELTVHLAAFSDPAEATAHVFTGPAGAPLRAGNWRKRVFYPAQVRAGISPLRRIHDLRHTAATLAIASGAHPKMVQEMLGHSNIAITLDVYGHLLPALHDDLASRLDEIYRAAGPSLGVMVGIEDAR